MEREKYNFLVDYYSNKFIKHKPEVITKMLEIILNKDDLILDFIQTQFRLKNLKHRSITLDVLAKDKDNNIYNIEFQNNNNELLERARYHHSMLDSNNLNKNTRFKELKKTYVIFICNFDIFKKGKACYEITKNVKDNNLNYNDNQHTIFVNCKYIDTSTDIGKLIQDLTSNNTDEKWYNEFKEGQDIGGESMGDGLERWKNKFRREGRREGKREGKKEGINLSIQGLIRENCSNEFISRVCNVSDEYIGNIRNKMKM